ncbi:unnamed protein product [Acanthoscelides obtectus]|nr:unnamed protein product [Acanthoscelides obtectus]CAK1654952.1 Lipid storage droplets surface-binding protein 1 [Acanthoscelides obtectus]
MSAEPPSIQGGSNVGVSVTHGPSPTCMESVNRISKLPVVESTIQTATSLYEKVKDYNTVTHWTLSTAESTVQKAVEVGKPIATPVIKNLEGPIKKVDGVFCTGLDYVENKLPVVKMPPNEILESTKEYVHNTVQPAVDTARSYAEPAVKQAMDIAQPAVKAAVEAAQPAVEQARHMVEPLVQPALDKMNAVKENVLHKVDEYLHRGHNHEGNAAECTECQRVRDEMEKQHKEQTQRAQEQ